MYVQYMYISTKALRHIQYTKTKVDGDACSGDEVDSCEWVGEERVEAADRPLKRRLLVEDRNDDVDGRAQQLRHGRRGERVGGVGSEGHGCSIVVAVKPAL